MISRFLAVLAAALPFLAAATQPLEMPSRVLEGHARAPIAFRAANLAPVDAVSLEAPREKSLAASVEQPGGRLRVADVRSLPKAARVGAWTAIPGGFVTKLRASSDEALGLRVKLELGAITAAIEVRVEGADGRMESMLIDPTSGGEAWTPWTAGATQVIELFSPVLPQTDAVRVGAVLHFTDSPILPKAAGSCTISTMCTTNDATLD